MCFLIVSGSHCYGEIWNMNKQIDVVLCTVLFPHKHTDKQNTLLPSSVSLALFIYDNTGLRLMSGVLAWARMCVCAKKREKGQLCHYTSLIRPWYKLIRFRQAMDRKTMRWEQRGRSKATVEEYWDWEVLMIEKYFQPWLCWACWKQVV